MLFTKTALNLTPIKAALENLAKDQKLPVVNIEPYIGFDRRSAVNLVQLLSSPLVKELPKISPQSLHQVIKGAEIFRDDHASEVAKAIVSENGNLTTATHLTELINFLGSLIVLAPGTDVLACSPDYSAIVEKNKPKVSLIEPLQAVIKKLFTFVTNVTKALQVQGQGNLAEKYKSMLAAAIQFTVFKNTGLARDLTQILIEPSTQKK